MAKKPIFVTLDEDLHAQMKSVAPLRGTNLQGAYDQALRSWLSGGTGSTVISKDNIVGVPVQMYDLVHVVRAQEKVSEAAKTLADAMTELQAAKNQQGQTIGAVHIQPPKPQSNPNLTEQIENEVGHANRLEKDYRAVKQPSVGARKRVNKRVSGGRT